MGSEDDDEIEDLIRRKMNDWKRGTAKKSEPSPPSPTIIELSDFNFEAELRKRPLMLVDFWAPWCGPCRWVSPILEEIARENAGSLALGKLNVDENPRTSSRFGIQGIPTIMIAKDGTIVDQIVGAAPKEVLMGRIRPYLPSSGA